MPTATLERPIEAVKDNDCALSRIFEEVVSRADKNLTQEQFDNLLDRCELELVNQFPEADLPVQHLFTPGLYIRQILMPAGTILTSRIHDTEHPYTISMGLCTVFTRKDGVQLLGAPFTGVTEPGTRRLLFMHEDTVWTTYHPTDLTDPEDIVKAITVERFNPLLPQLTEGKL